MDAPGSARTPLVGFHATGGHVTELERLAALLDRGRPVWAIRSRACAPPAEEHPTMDALAEAYADLVPGGRCVLFGWSLGGLVAHATAVALERKGVEVAFVGIVDAAFGGPAPRAGDDRVTALGMAIHIWNPSPPPDAAIRRALAALPAELDAVAFGEERGLLPPGAMTHADFAALLGMLPRHRELVLGYRPRPCRAPLVHWRADPRFQRTPCDWTAATTGGYEERIVGGTHFAIMRAPYLETIAKELDQLAARIDREA